MKMTRFLTVFALFMGVFALLAWLSGYDFNYRSPDVAFGFGSALFVSLIFAGSFAMHEED